MNTTRCTRSRGRKTTHASAPPMSAWTWTPTTSPVSQIMDESWKRAPTISQ